MFSYHKLIFLANLNQMKDNGLGLKLVYSFINLIIPLPVTCEQYSWSDC